jgi:hypothetical protein
MRGASKGREGRACEGDGCERDETTPKKEGDREEQQKKRNFLQAPTGIEPVISCLLGKRFAI